MVRNVIRNSPRFIALSMVKTKATTLGSAKSRSHKAILISQGFNQEKGGLATFLEHCERADTTDIISAAKFSASDEDSHTKRKKKRSNFKEREGNGKKRHKKLSSLYCSLHGEKKSHNTRKCKVIKARPKDKDNHEYSTKYYKRKSREVKLL